LHTAFHQLSEEFLVRIAGRHLSFGVVGIVVQSHVTGICVKDGNDLGLGLPVRDVVRDVSSTLRQPNSIAPRL
jgi:hypothetical protein